MLVLYVEMEVGAGVGEIECVEVGGWVGRRVLVGEVPCAEDSSGWKENQFVVGCERKEQGRSTHVVDTAFGDGSVFHERSEVCTEVGVAGFVGDVSWHRHLYQVRMIEMVDVCRAYIQSMVGRDRRSLTK